MLRQRRELLFDPGEAGFVFVEVLFLLDVAAEEPDLLDEFGQKFGGFRIHDVWRRPSFSIMRPITYPVSPSAARTWWTAAHEIRVTAGDVRSAVRCPRPPARRPEAGCPSRPACRR